MKYYIHKYLKQEKPKTVKQWADFLDVELSTVYSRIREKDLIQIEISEETISLLSTSKTHA